MQILVLDALLGDDADRLRRLPQGHAQRRGRACRRGRVRVRVFGDRTALANGRLRDSDRGQGQSTPCLCLLSLLRRLRGWRREGDTGCQHVHGQGQGAHSQLRAGRNGVL
ncbi:hypothetical protein D3C85_1398830 [compost metagenome]